MAKFDLKGEQGKQKAIAEESLKTRKAREKLKKQLEIFDRQITPQALEEKTVEIHRRIARLAQERVVLKTKNICLFDENQNTAELSQRVVQLASQLKNEFQLPKDVAERFYQQRKSEPVDQ
jgi:hypothetical protein